MCESDPRRRRVYWLPAMLLAAGCGDQFTPTEAPPAAQDPCNGPGALSDAYDDGVLSETFLSRLYSGADIQEQDGALTFLGPLGASGSRDARYAVDLRNSFVVVEVPNAEGGFLDTRASLSLTFGGSQSVSITGRESSSEEGTEQLYFTVSSDEGDSNDSTPYDATAHRWWRIGEQDGVVSFQASPEGTDWTTYHEAPTPAFVEAGTITLSASVEWDALEPRAVRFDNLNPQGGSFCGMDQLQEPFDTEPTLSWRRDESTDCTLVQSGGVLEATVQAGGSGQCTLATRHGYDLRDDSVTFAFSALPDADSGVSVELTLSSGDLDELEMSYQGGTLDASSQIGTAQSSGSTELGAGPAWWRIRESDGRVEFEVSTDGTSFQAVLSAMVAELPPAFLVSLRLNVSSAQPAATILALDAIN